MITPFEGDATLLGGMEGSIACSPLPAVALRNRRLIANQREL
jgi:hypothetical protein